MSRHGDERPPGGLSMEVTVEESPEGVSTEVTAETGREPRRVS